MNNILDTINRKRHQSLPVCLIKDSMLQLSSKFLSYSDGDHITDLYFMRTSLPFLYYGFPYLYYLHGHIISPEYSSCCAYKSRLTRQLSIEVPLPSQHSHV